MEPHLARLSPTSARAARAAGRSGRLPPLLALALVVAIGINIRAIFGATPPLIPVISADLSMSGTAASLLTSLPVLAMAICAPLGQVLSRRLGTDGAMMLLLLLVGAGELSRLVPGSAVLLIASAGLIGGALGAISTLSPAFIGHHLPRLRGLATGIYTTSMALGVGLAAGIAQPVASSLGGWRVSLALWGAVALLLVVALLAARSTGAAVPPAPRTDVARSLPLREARAWLVAALYGVAMFLGFGVITWLPSLFIEVGVSPLRAANYLVLFQSVQLFSILTLTPLTDRLTGRRAVFATAMSTSTAGLAMLTLEPLDWALPGLLLAGFGIGASSSLALVAIQDASTSPQDATRLSAMAMLVSFTAGAFSPLLMGALKDLTGSLVPGFGVCLVVSASSLLLLRALHPVHRDPSPSRAEPPER